MGVGVVGSMLAVGVHVVAKAVSGDTGGAAGVALLAGMVAWPGVPLPPSGCVGVPPPPRPPAGPQAERYIPIRRAHDRTTSRLTHLLPFFLLPYSRESKTSGAMKAALGFPPLRSTP